MKKKPHPIIITNGNDDDGFWFTYMAMYILGAANVVSFLSYILCIDYFNVAYPEGRVGFVFPTIYMSVLLIVSVFILMAGRILSMDFRIYFGLGVQLFGLCLVPFNQLFTFKIFTSFGITLLALVACSLATATVQSSIYGLAGVFGKEFIQALEAGKGAAGVLLVLMRCLTKWMFSTSPYSPLSIYYFFGMSQIITIIAIIFYCYLHQVEFAKPKFNEYRNVQAATPIAGQTRSRALSYDEKSHLLQPSHHSKEPFELEQQEKQTADSMITAQSVLYNVRKPAIIVFCTFAICLGCFPGLTTSIHSITYNMQDWFPVVLVAAFNSGDYVGKTLAGVYLILTHENLHIPIILELSFFPLFIWDVYTPFGDLLTILLVFSLGSFTGYVGCACLMIGPSVVSENEKELAGIIGSLFLISGLFIGSYIGLAIGSLTNA